MKYVAICYLLNLKFTIMKDCSNSGDATMVIHGKTGTLFIQITLNQRKRKMPQFHISESMGHIVLTVL